MCGSRHFSTWTSGDTTLPGSVLRTLKLLTKVCVQHAEHSPRLAERQTGRHTHTHTVWALRQVRRLWNSQHEWHCCLGGLRCSITLVPFKILRNGRDTEHRPFETIYYSTSIYAANPAPTCYVLHDAVLGIRISLPEAGSHTSHRENTSVLRRHHKKFPVGYPSLERKMSS